MWNARVESLEGGRVRRTVLAHQGEGRSLRYSEVTGLWRVDAHFRAYFSALLADAPFPAFAWETPPVTTATFDREFEFVLIDDPVLARGRADPDAFRDVLESARPAQVAEFANLGTDAHLLAPRQGEPSEAYAHLAAFARTATDSVRDALWMAVGAALDRHVHDRPTWLSTAGHGVPWLHVRLDSRPKYYRFGPYREWPPAP